jgi:putative oxidoreductase
MKGVQCDLLLVCKETLNLMQTVNIMLKLLETGDHWAGLIARWSIAVVLFPHGAQKLLGWWGGHGFTSTMEFFLNIVKLPYLVGLLVILAEFFCPLFLIAGFGVRIFAFATMLIMMGIIFTVQNKYFFMNWFGTQDGEGMEFFLLMIGLCLVVVVAGAGKFSVDRFIAK